MVNLRVCGVILVKKPAGVDVDLMIRVEPALLLPQPELEKIGSGGFLV